MEKYALSNQGASYSLGSTVLCIQKKKNDTLVGPYTYSVEFTYVLHARMSHSADMFPI
jgi:hypothetical protein